MEATQAAYGAYCRAIALRILGSEEDTEECLADVWLRVWNAVPPERPEQLSSIKTEKKRIWLQVWTNFFRTTRISPPPRFSAG